MVKKKVVLADGQIDVKATRSVFFPGARRRMNIIPMVLNVFIPWFVFCTMVSIWSFRFHHVHENWCQIIFICSWLVPFFIAMIAWKSNADDMAPMWYKFAVLSISLAILLGTLYGCYNYQENMLPFYENNDLMQYPNVDPGHQRGQDLVDAGRVYFTEGTKLDFNHVWHFRHVNTYCVVPIISAPAADGVYRPSTGSYDFWAVGKDCCAVAGTTDFRCGDFMDPTVRSGLRLLNNADRPYYRLAIQQAEALYDMISTYPLLFEWTRDPLYDVLLYRDRGYKFALLGFFEYLAFCVTAVVLATCQFAYIGRAPRDPALEYATKHAEAEIKAGGIGVGAGKKTMRDMHGAFVAARPPSHRY